MRQCADHAGRWKVDGCLPFGQPGSIGPRQPAASNSRGVPLGARDLAGSEQSLSPPELKCGLQQFWCFQKRVAMHHTKTNELCLFQAWNHAKHALLLSPFEIRLKPHKVPKTAVLVFLA